MSTSSLNEIRNDLNTLKFAYDSMSPTIGDEIIYIVDKLEEIIAELPQNDCLPCPWCGEEADVVELTTHCDETTFYKISCNDHTCLGANIHMWYDSIEKAMYAWNNRSYLNLDGLPIGLTISDDELLLNWKGVNYVKQIIDENVSCNMVEVPFMGWKCSKCGKTTKGFYGGREFEQPKFCPSCGHIVQQKSV